MLHPRERGISAVLAHISAKLVNYVLQKEAGDSFRGGSVVSWIGHTKPRFQKWAV